MLADPYHPEQPPISLRAVLDSGAGRSYLVSPKNYNFPIPELPYRQFTVGLADGHSTNCSGYYKTEATTSSVTGDPVLLGNIELIKLPSVEFSEYPYVLIGRDYMDFLKITLLGSSEAFIGPHLIYKSDSFSEDTFELYDVINLVTSTLRDSEDITNPTVDLRFCQPTYDPSTNPENIRIVLDDSEKQDVITLLEDQLLTSWVSVYGCPGFFTRLHKLSDLDFKDNPDQLYSFQLKSPPIENNQFTRHLYAAKLFSRLKDSDKDDYRTLVRGYVDQNMWKSKEDFVRENPEATILPPVNVFLRPAGGGRKARLVMDFQNINSLWPKATAAVPDIWCIINAIRAFGEEVLATLDIRQAFYIIRLFGVHFHLITGVGEYVSDRMCFGTSVGPSELDESLNLLFKQLWAHFVNSLICKFVDDIGISGLAENVVKNLRLLIATLRVCGFEVQLKKFSLISTAAKADALMAMLKKATLPRLIADASKILGVTFRYEADHIKLSCSRAGRFIEAKRLISDGSLTGFTKKSVFAICGLIGFDPGRLHPESRCFADSLRSIVGSVYAKQPWDAPLNISLMTPDQGVAFRDLIAWVSTVQETCEHFSKISTSSTTRHFELFSDASVTGGGFVLLCNGSEVCREGYRWKGPQTRYHINRLELLALIKAVQPTVDLIEFLEKNSIGKLNTKLDIRCDNKATVCWVTDADTENLKKLPSIRRAMDRKALLSLASSLTDEIDSLRQAGVTVNLSHVAGSGNPADGCSRLYDRKCTNNKTLAFILNEQSSANTNPERSAGVVATNEGVTDFVRRVERSSRSRTVADTSNQNSLIERWSAHCRSPDQVLGLARASRLIFEVLKNHSKPASLPESYPDVSDEDLMSVVRSCQLADSFFSSGFTDVAQRKKIAVGPVVFSAEHGIFLFKSGLPNGSTVWQYLIPKSAKNFRSLLLKSAHRLVLHSGANQTLAAVNSWGYYLPGGMVTTRSVLANCYPCKVNNTLRVFSGETGYKCELEQLVKLEPYHTVAADYIRLGEKTTVLAVTCHMSKHTTWLLAKNETTAEAVKLLQQVQFEQGGLRKVHVDRASYFRSDEFSRECMSKLGAVVVYVPTGAPWESLVEKIYDLGQRRLRIALRYLSGHISKLDELEIQRLLNYVCFLLNTRPVGRFSAVADVGVTEPITPDMLRYGYTRKLGSFSSALTECGLNLTSSQREVRSTFLELFWQELKAKTAKACGGRSGKHKGSRSALCQGQPVLVYKAAKVKLGHVFVLAHVQSRVSETHVKVVFSDGKVSLENINNVNVLDLDVAQVSFGPTMVDAVVEVLFTMKDGSGQWFKGQVTRVGFDGSVIIRWFNGDRASTLNLWHPSIEWRYARTDASVDLVENASGGPCSL